MAGLFSLKIPYMKKLLLFVIPLLSFFSCSKEPEDAVQTPSPNTQEIQPVQDRSLIPGTVIVQLSDAMIDVVESAGSPVMTKSAGLNRLSEMLEITSIERVFPDAGRFEARHREAGLHRWYRIEYAGSAPSTKAAEGLENLEGVLAVEVPHKIAPRSINYFNDPYSWYQWNFYNDGSLDAGFRKGSDVNVVPVWENYTTGSKDVIVAVIDSGVDPEHEDLAGVVIPAGPEGSKNFVSVHGEYEIEPMMHGTHVGGIIGAINNNGIGVCGIAGGNDGTGGVRLLSCAIFASGTDDTQVGGSGADAIVWAADHGAVIANNSWGYEYDDESTAKSAAAGFDANPSSLKSAIDYFIDYAGLDENGNQTGPMKGGVVLFASGNQGWKYDVPGMYERVVAVGSIQHDNSMASYSNYGEWVDVLAPGGGERKAEQMILSTSPGSYVWASGTSMACPHAAGVAALLVSHFGGPGFTNDQLVERLLLSSKMNVIDTKGKPVGGGRLDAYAAFTYKGRTPVSFSTDYSGGFTFRSHESAVIKYRINGNDDGRLSVSAEGGSPVITATCTETTVDFAVNALKGAPGKYSSKVTVGKGSMFETSMVLEVEVLENHAPKVTKVFENIVLDAETTESTTFALKDYFADEDGETLEFVPEVEAGSTASATVSAGVLTVKALTYGQTGVSVTGRDARGAEVKQSFTLLARDSSRVLDLYPNPVSNVLNVRPAHDATVSLSFYNQAGAKVLEKNVEAKLFSPAKLDLKGLAAGVYTVKASYDGESCTMTIVKI